VHGVDGFPHAREDAVCAEDVDDEVPRVGGVVVVAEVPVPRQVEEGGGGAWVRVG